MSRTNGRDMRFKKNGVVVAVANTKTVTINNNPVDVTGDTDDGFVTLLSRPGSRQMTMAISGYTENETLRDAAVTGTALLDDCTVEYLSSDGLGTVIYAIQGDFFLASFSETGASDGGLEFSADFQSSGAWSKVSV